MPYLAVDKDETECIFKDEPKREKFIFICGDCNDDYIILPEGSIEKLLGYSISWEDEPVEI